MCVSSVPVGILVGWSLGCVLRAARPPEAAISALARSWLHVVAVHVTLALGAVFHGSIRVVRDFLRRGACRNPGQRNPGGQDESDETHEGNLPLGRALTARTTIYSHISGAHHCEVGHTGRFFVAGCAGSSGDLLPPSPPAEKATARQDQTRKPSTDDGTGDRRWFGRGDDLHARHGNTGGCSNSG
jgi:hypothetical protein